jgi:hypothetical protein
LSTDSSRRVTRLHRFVINFLEREMSGDQESGERNMIWRAKPLKTIRVELVRVNGKHARLCSEAARRLEGLSKQIEQIRLIAVSDRSSVEKVAYITAKIEGVVGG